MPSGAFSEPHFANIEPLDPEGEPDLVSSELIFTCHLPHFTNIEPLDASSEPHFPFGEPLFSNVEGLVTNLEPLDASGEPLAGLVGRHFDRRAPRIGDDGA